jgi:asparagine synthase (glutamine-hydrolysing)
MRRGGPCLVSFSGGRDSSVLLAAAVRTARAAGLDDPIPITLRFASAETDERHWQERVVGDLGLADWEVLDVGDELDHVGPVATAVARRHGLLYPPNAYAAVSRLERARGGTLLTGMGGDEMLEEWRWREHVDALRRLPRPRPADVRALGRLLSPGPVRRAAERRMRLRLYHFPWLRPHAAASARRAAAAERAGHPRLWPAYVRWRARRRRTAMAAWSYELLAAEAGAAIAHPLLDGGFLAAISDAGGRFGWPRRLDAHAAIFAGLLPDALLRRTTKAPLTGAFWTDRTRRFASEWDGGGVDPALVDPDALRDEWRSDSPDARTGLLLHQAWLRVFSKGG